MENKLIELPKGYSVKNDDCVGVSYYNDKNLIIFQHPVDNNSARKIVWALYNINKK